MARPKRIRDKVYRIVYEERPENGRARQQKMETLYDVTKQEAEAILAKRQEAVRKGEQPPDCDLTMSELFDRFMIAKRKRLEQTSIDRYDSLISTYLRPVLGNTKLAALKKAHVMGAFDAWQSGDGRKRSGRTLRHAYDLLRATLNWAVRFDFVPTNIATKIAPEDLPRARKPESPVLDVAELRLLFEEAQKPTDRAPGRGV